MVILVGCSAAFFCSCRKGSGISYIPEVLTDEEYSGAGYALNFVPNQGELIFMVSCLADATKTLVVRGFGKAEAEIIIDGQHYPVSFQDGSKWEEVSVSVHLHSGLNAISVIRKKAGESTLRVDYIEIQ